MTDPLIQEIELLEQLGFHHEQLIIGPHLREVVGLPPDAPDHEVAPYAIAAIVRATTTLDSDLAKVFLKGAGYQAAGGRSRSKRVEDAATAIQRSVRTVYRYQTKAARQIAEALRTRPVPIDDWTIVDADYMADLRDVVPRLVLRRRIRSLVQSLAHFEDRLVFPRLAGRHLPVHAINGCRLIADKPLGESARRLEIGLRPALAWGDERDIEIAILPPADALEPLVVLVPRTPLPRLRVEVRFGERRPTAVWRFSEALLGGGFLIEEDWVSLDPTAALHVHEFRSLNAGRAYGIAWRW